ncbi:DUF5908 family protein [Janthinobacterium fluminis]|uniref:DUF5908 family protein n=1 Tax=Janthinobacterium fluminis TaxID=2987524 RepID=A0ABT5K7D8_9BURK|nr:DUF5908 family protein [Janthinobacterium fluminis]MDC8760333.1 DUF5908 family protein [Janthinobacterium fluminis]
MAIEIQQLHIKSSVVQGAGGAAKTRPADAAASDCSSAGDSCSAAQRELVLAECRRLIRTALGQLQER